MTPASLPDWQPGTPPAELTASLFDGELIVVRNLAVVRQLKNRARRIVADLYGTADLPRTERLVDPVRFRELATRARDAVALDAPLQRLWIECLAALGFEAGSLHRDRIKLRVVPSAEPARGRVVRPLPAHRDTWGSGIDAQINWWLPLHPLAATRTMIVWPEAFRQPLVNDSADWDYDALRQDRDRRYPLLPTVREEPPGPGQPVLIEPGELLAFSAAHLHAGVADDSGLCRFSLDTRTVWAGDLLARHGAPNVDGYARKARWEWFRRDAGEQAAR